MPAKEQEMLNQTIKSLPFSEEFKSVLRRSGLNTIGEIIDKPATELLKIDGFNYHLLQELIQFLEEKNLANLLKE
jgi:DNA-directed RNA polymerase alpha subunit